MPHHDMLPLAPAPDPALVVGWLGVDSVRLRLRLHAVGDLVVPGAAGVLLHDSREGMCHDPASNSFANCSTHAAAHAAANTATHTASHAVRTCGSLQLRRRPAEHLGAT